MGCSTLRRLAGGHACFRQTSNTSGATTTKQISVPLTNDLTVESLETILMQLSSPTGDAVLGRAQAVATIVDNDAAAVAAPVPGAEAAGIHDLWVDDQIIYANKTTDGIVAIDYDICIGCAYCDVACPYQARFKITKEDFAYDAGAMQNEIEREISETSVARFSPGRFPDMS